MGEKPRERLRSLQISIAGKSDLCSCCTLSTAHRTAPLGDPCLSRSNVCRGTAATSHILRMVNPEVSEVTVYRAKSIAGKIMGNTQVIRMWETVARWGS